MIPFFKGRHLNLLGTNIPLRYQHPPFRYKGTFWKGTNIVTAFVSLFLRIYTFSQFTCTCMQFYYLDNVSVVQLHSAYTGQSHYNWSLHCALAAKDKGSAQCLFNHSNIQLKPWVMYYTLTHTVGGDCSFTILTNENILMVNIAVTLQLCLHTLCVWVL